MKTLLTAILFLAATGSASAQESLVPISLIPLANAQAADSQENAPFAEFAKHVKPRDQIFITDREGRQTVGRFLRTSPDGIVALVAGEERTFDSAGVGRIDKRDRLWNGALIGAVPFALVGMAGAGASCSPDCAKEMSVAAAVFGGIGAGVGALIDMGIRGYRTVYGPELPPPNAIGQGRPVASTADLWTRVRLGDSIRVILWSGDEVNGTFVRTSPASLFIVVQSQLRELPAAQVRRVSRRGNRYRQGALIGAVMSGALAAAGGGGGAVFGAAFGALWGAVIGAAIPKHPVVLESGGPATVRIEPVIGIRRGGVAVSLKF